MNCIVFVEDDVEVGFFIVVYLVKYDIDVIVELCGDWVEDFIFII